jgi:hypothetical protein
LPNTPFTSSLKKIHLKNLESKDVHKLLTTPNAEFIPLFAPATAEYIYELTVGQPYLVQMIAHAVTDRFNRELDKDNKPEPVFTKADVDAVLEGATFDQFGQPYVQSQRDRLPLDQPIYAAVLRTIAQDEKGISAADLDAALQSQYPWSAVELILAVLEEQQVIRLNKDRWQVGELLRRALIN